MIREMKDAGLSNMAIFLELAGAVSIFAVPLIIMIAGEAFE